VDGRYDYYRSGALGRSAVSHFRSLALPPCICFAELPLIIVLSLCIVLHALEPPQSFCPRAFYFSLYSTLVSFILSVSLSLSLSLNPLLANGYCVFVLCLVMLSLFVLLVAKPLSWDLLLHSTSITVIRIGRTHLVE
jgi:hypothetical protein